LLYLELRPGSHAITDIQKLPVIVDDPVEACVATYNCFTSTVTLAYNKPKRKVD